MRKFREKPIFDKGTTFEYIEKLKHPKYQGEFEVIGHRRKREGDKNSPWQYCITPVGEEDKYDHGEKWLKERHVRGRFKITEEHETTEELTKEE